MENHYSLLIVDDSRIIRRAIRSYLADLPLEVIGEAADGNEALQMFENLHPQLVTLDITMPEPDGIVVLKRMTEMNPDARILVVTALTDKATSLRVLNMGAVGILHKPITAAKIQEVVRGLLESMPVGRAAQ